jgi:excisionase family DNA binding protein
MTTEKPWLTVKEAAKHAAVSPDTIYSACERGELQHTKVSWRRAIRVKAAWIDEWLEQHTCGETIRA